MVKHILTILLFFISITVSATTYYVSATGSDSNSGLTEVLPWKTLDKVNSFTFAAGDQILFKRGDTFYGKLVIGQSGSSGSPITYGTYGFGDKPIITGFATVSTWTDLGFNIWQSNAVSTMSSCNMVVINGTNTPMGRTPNTGWYTYSSSTSTSITSSSLNASTTNWTGAQAVIKKERYVIDRPVITSASGTTVNFVNPSSYTGHANWGFFIQSDTRTLDQQDEWYFNSSDGKISVYSTSEPTDVKLASRDTLVYLVNKNYITFDGISFTGANGQVFYLGNSKNVIIKNCSFDFNYNGIKGYQFGGTSSNLLIDSCTFNHTNNDAISLPTEFAGASVTHNAISNTGVFEGLAASGQTRWGINTTGDDYTIQYNIVSNTGYVGIGFNGSDILCDRNVVDSFCLITDDGGGLYTGNPQSGVIISNNIVINGIGNDGGTNSTNNGKASGIYCDDNSSGMIILNNSIANIIFAGIFLHNSNDIEVRGNTTFNCGIGLLVDADNASKHTTGIESKKNTFIASTVGTYFTPQNQVAAWFKSNFNDIQDFGNIDSNYYARPIDDNLTIWYTQYKVNDYKYNLAQWRTISGYDTHSSKSPISVSSVAQLSYYYNPMNEDSTLDLGSSTYVDMANTSYTGDVVLSAYSSLVLINTGTLITPTITWANPSSITYGTALSSTQLNATADAAGTFSYNYSSGTILNAKDYTLTVIFTPTDGTTYTTATKSVPLTVNKATATLSYSGLTKTYDGLPKSPTVLTSPSGLTGINITYNGVGSVPTNVGSYTVVAGINNQNYSATPINGTFVISPLAGTFTVSNLNYQYDSSLHTVSVATSDPRITYTISGGSKRYKGNYTVTVHNTNTNFNVPDAVVTLTITAGQAPTPSWTPANMTYPAAIGASQTNATDSKGGTYSYTPTTGFVPSAGSFQMSLNFTPSDTNLAPITGITRTITVSKGTDVMTASNTTQYYDATPKAITISTLHGGTVVVTYDGTTTTPPTSIGDHSFSAVYTDANWQATTITGTLHIVSNAATIYMSNYANLVYDGSPKVPTVTSPYSYTLDYSPSNHTDVGSVQVIATINDGVHTGADTVTMTIIKATPTGTWASISPVTYPYVVQSGIQNASTATPGSWDYNITVGDTLVPGTYNIIAIFTPTDAANYNSITLSNSITVNKGSASINIANILKQYNGDVQYVTATTTPANLDSLVVTYTGGHTNAGSYPFTAHLVSDLYNASDVSGTLTISKGDYNLSWPIPTPIQQGTPLSNAQLNPASSIDGSFTQTYPIGYIPQTNLLLTATFIPTDSVNYNTQNISVFLAVYGSPFTNFIIGDYYENK